MSVCAPLLKCLVLSVLLAVPRKNTTLQCLLSGPPLSLFLSLSVSLPSFIPLSQNNTCRKLLAQTHLRGTSTTFQYEREQPGVFFCHSQQVKQKDATNIMLHVEFRYFRTNSCRVCLNLSCSATQTAQIEPDSLG